MKRHGGALAILSIVALALGLCGFASADHSPLPAPTGIRVTPTPFYENEPVMMVSFVTKAAAPTGYGYTPLFVSRLPRGECAAYASTAQTVRGDKNIRYRIALHARDYWMLAPMGKPGPLYATFCPGHADVRVAIVKLSTIRHHYLLPNEPPWLYDWGIKLRVIRFP